MHHKASTLILGVSAGSLGALLVGVGAILLLADAVGGAAGLSGATFGGTLPTPERRLSAGMEAAGAIYVAAGSGLLLAASGSLTAVAVLVAVGVAAAIAYLVMAVRLFAHHKLLHGESGLPHRSLVWCLVHPRWRPPGESWGRAGHRRP